MAGIKPATTRKRATDPDWVYRGTAALQHGRWSCSGASYFITGNLCRPLTGLTERTLGERVRLALFGLQSSGCWRLRTWVVMPDHLHLVFTLCNGFTLGETVRRFKGPLSPALRIRNLRWQANFFDHRIRPDEDCFPIFLYVFLNPYRAGLIVPAEKWPWYYCSAEDWEWFGPLTNQSASFPEWIR